MYWGVNFCARLHLQDFESSVLCGFRNLQRSGLGIPMEKWSRWTQQLIGIECF